MISSTGTSYPAGLILSFFSLHVVNLWRAEKVSNLSKESDKVLFWPLVSVCNNSPQFDFAYAQVFPDFPVPLTARELHPEEPAAATARILFREETWFQK
ncbi:hypothetical protein HDV63DRAFT_28099 [Trichoderma sp. SZMC 28014]